MNNDNLKRVLNKIGRAAQQQSEDPSVFDLLEQERRTSPTEKERTEKFCDCMYNLMDKATDLVTSRDGWEAHLKWITNYCIRHLFRPGFDLRGIDTVATAARNCNSFSTLALYTECRIHCENKGYIKNTAPFSKCMLKCVELGPKPPFYVNVTNGVDPFRSFPRLVWEVKRYDS